MAGARHVDPRLDATARVGVVRARRAGELQACCVRAHRQLVVALAVHHQTRALDRDARRRRSRAHVGAQGPRGGFRRSSRSKRRAGEGIEQIGVRVVAADVRPLDRRFAALQIQSYCLLAAALPRPCRA